MEFRQLLPEPRRVEVEKLLAALAPGERAPSWRPHVAVNFILSGDGHATVDGRSGSLGGDSDRAMFHGLREQFDAVLAGTGTLRTERYGRILGSEARRHRRRERGMSPEPLACVLTLSGSVPADIPLFDEPEARVVVLSPAPLSRGEWRAQVELVQLDRERAPIGAALEALREHCGVRSLLCEGGPQLFAALLREEVVDELFLTIAPTLTGGDGPGATSGEALPALASLKLAWVLEQDDHLFLRYALS